MELLLNTLYVQTDGAVLRLDHENVVATVEKETKLRIPLHHVGAIVAMGRVSVTSPLIARLAKEGKTVAHLDGSGRFLYRIEGARSGNVLLRAAQFQVLYNRERQIPIVQAIVAGKLYNCRQNLLRAARETSDEATAQELRAAAEDMARDIRRLQSVTDLDALRGIEGINAKRYFAQWRHQLKVNDASFDFAGRNRRPPRDPVNAVLSFLYSLLCNDAISALESVGLDPQVGYLHTLRPGRPSLALDLMEELRPILADRIALTLINRRQLQPHHFESLPGGAVSLTASGRREILTAYQERKKDTVTHPLLKQRIPMGVIVLVQARLLARAIRKDHTEYVPFFYK